MAQSLRHRLSLSSLLLLTVLLAAGCTVAPASAGPQPGTEARVIDAGAAIPLVRLSRMRPRLPTKAPHESRLDCRKDGDCAFWSRPCACPPCGETWRQVVNRKELARLQDTWARRRCARPVCKSCEGSYLGTRAICSDGQCAAE